MLTWTIFFVSIGFVFLSGLLISIALAGNLTHQWKSPAFSGQGYSAHALTIENQEFTRKAALKDKKDAAER